MRILRRVSLVLSLTLIVAIAVGFMARRAEVAHERDLGLTTAAELGASQMSSIVNAIAIAAVAGADPDTVASTLVESHPALGVCAVSADAERCTGDGPAPDPAVVTALREARTGDELLGRPVVTAYESSITVEVDGPELSVVAVMPFDALGNRGAARVWSTTFLPEDLLPGEFTVARGVRQTAEAVPGVPGVYAVAAADDAIRLAGEERVFYGLIFGLALVLLVLASVTLVTENRSLVERASFDPLTRLPNRGEFERAGTDAIATAERQGRSLCLLLFDLNDFKSVNDTYGHHAGDEMLKVVADRLRKAVRDDDLVARWGGDEFVVMLSGVGDADMAVRRATQLAEQVAGRARLEGIAMSLRVKVSVGIALWPFHGAELDRLVEAADHAMYQAKRLGELCHLAELVPVPIDPIALAH